MDNIMKIVMLGAGLLLTIGVIVIGVAIFSSSQALTTAGSEKISTLTKAISDKDTDIYNNKVVNGSQVIDAIRTYVEGNGELTVKVTTLSSSTITYDQKTAANAYKVSDPTASDFINPTGQFSGVVIVNKNKVKIGIEFTQK